MSFRMLAFVTVVAAILTSASLFAAGPAGCSVDSAPATPGCTLTGGASSSPAASSDGKPSVPAGVFMKGAALYCWKESGRWFYSIVPDTNALPQKEHLVAARVSSVEQLESTLKSVPKGTPVFFNAREVEGMKLASPPSSQFARIKSACEKRGLNLVVVR